VLTFRWIAAALFIASIPLFLVLTNVRIAGTWERVYAYSYTQYDAPEVTGFDRFELDRATKQIVWYFNHSRGDALLDIRVRDGSDVVPLFNQREILHMRDVRDLFQVVFRVQELLFVYIVGYIAAVYLWSRERSMRHLARQAIYAGGATVALLSAAALSMLMGFDGLFEQFHLLSFSNDLWRLNPATDHLIQMFPQGFWFDVSLAVGVVTIIQGGLIALLGLGYTLMADRRAHRRMLQRRRRPAANVAV
jgi:integral membrane protein (TIGR01906 family)